jgi:hypothetical protein
LKTLDFYPLVQAASRAKKDTRNPLERKKMRQWPEAEAPPQPPDDWAEKRIELHGLKGAAEFNGREGAVQGSMDNASLRYEVLLDPLTAEEEPKIVKVKAENLKLLASGESSADLAAVLGVAESENPEKLEKGRKVTIQGLKSKAELNGCKGVVESFDEAKERYNVKVDNTGQVLALKIDNLQALVSRCKPSTFLPCPHSRIVCPRHAPHLHTSAGFPAHRPLGAPRKVQSVL